MHFEKGRMNQIKLNLNNAEVAFVHSEKFERKINLPN